MKSKYYVVFGIAAMLILTAIIGCAQQQIQSPQEQQLPAGIIRACEYTMGEDTCGKCYCLETPEKGCEIIDISEVGDLANAVDKAVSYESTRDQNIIQSSKMCPHNIKLYKIIKIRPLWTTLRFVQSLLALRARVGFLGCQK